MIDWLTVHPKLGKTPKAWLEEYGPGHTSKELKLLWESQTGEQIGPAAMSRARDRYGIKLNDAGWEKVAQGNRVAKLPQKLTDLELIEEIQHRGFAAVALTAKVDQRIKIDASRFEGDKYKFGVVADTQLCSRYQQLTYLRHFYVLCEEEGIKDIYHAGDVSDGQEMYRGHTYEIFLHGADAQRDYIKEYYPTYEGCTTHMIGGSHDESHWKRAGADILAAVARGRQDIKFHGLYGAFLDIGPITGYVMHGDGGVAYARSYKMQKIIEQFTPENKPDLLLLGHYHVPCHLPAYRNVEGFQLPCFQAQTPYLKKKGLAPVIGGMIITITFNDVDRESGIAIIEPKYVPFYVPRENDWE